MQRAADGRFYTVKAYSIKKLSLLLVLCIFFCIETASFIVAEDIQANKFAYLAQGLGLVCTGFMFYMYLTTFKDDIPFERKFLSFVRLILTFFFAFGCLSVFISLVVFSSDFYVQNDQLLSRNTLIYGFLIGVMHGRDWRFKFFNAVVWMQGLKTVYWLIVSLKTLSAPVSF
jgi:hypothetical protein